MRVTSEPGSSGGAAGAPSVWAGARRLVFPDRCLLCGALVQSAGGLCAGCWAETPFLRGLCCDRCGAPLLGPDPGIAAECDECRERDPPWGRGRAVLRYAGGGRRLVLALKHGDRLDLAPALGGWMAARAAPLLAPETLIVPVPLHWRRLLGRRYNQAAVLAQAMARALGRRAVPDLLTRHRATPPLGDSGREARAAALAGSVSAGRRARGRIAGRPVLLVDDVLTTGATLSACAAACLDAGATRVDVIVLARAAREP